LKKKRKKRKEDKVLHCIGYRFIQRQMLLLLMMMLMMLTTVRLTRLQAEPAATPCLRCRPTLVQLGRRECASEASWLGMDALELAAEDVAARSVFPALLADALQRHGKLRGVRSACASASVN